MVICIESIELQRLVILENMFDKRSVGKKKIFSIKTLREWYGRSSVELFQATVNNVKMAMLVGNFQNKLA